MFQSLLVKQVGCTTISGRRADKNRNLFVVKAVNLQNIPSFSTETCVLAFYGEEATLISTNDSVLIRAVYSSWLFFLFYNYFTKLVSDHVYAERRIVSEVSMENGLVNELR
uniref:Sm domain-containing protein n=1 Tax=Steinernema glaseri TaxID=37863 RepID=A0A1I7YL99_9BILA